MEIGDTNTDRIRKLLQKGDLDVVNSAGAIISTSIGSLIALRDNLESIFGRGLVYFSISGQPWYLVHWNDLTPEKQKSIEDKRKRKDVRFTRNT